jgi:putative methyltransferase (TIGR04325 family)
MIAELFNFLKLFKKNIWNQKRTEKVGFFGDYSTWQQAKMEAGGYEAPTILEKTKAAMREILAGRAKFERDSVLLPKEEYPWPLISCLLFTAASNRGRLSVLDFGGALGSSYYQCRPFLENVPELTWAVVEQGHYVEAGRFEFSQRPVSFYGNPTEAVLGAQPNLLLLSSVLPYLPDPWACLGELLALNIRHMVIDRLPFLETDRDRLTVQIVPREIYPASYPAWFFSRSRLLSICTRHGYRERAEWPCADDWNPEGDKANFTGLFMGKSA